MRFWAFLFLALPLAAADSGRGYIPLGFDRLAGFNFVAPEPDSAKPPAGDEEQIPAAIRALDGRKAVVTGFMLPTKLENGKATEFLIMANQMACCFGVVPVMNDWVIVRMPRGTDVIQDVPISFYGKFHVGPILQEGYLAGIYCLDADRAGEVRN